MLIVEVMNESRSSTVDSVHIALAEMLYAFDIRNPSPTSGMLLRAVTRLGGVCQTRHTNPEIQTSVKKVPP